MGSNLKIEKFSIAIPIFFISWLLYSAINYPERFAMYAAKGLTTGSVYALIALGIGLIYTTTGILNLAHGEVFMLAAVTSSALLVGVFNATSPSPGNFALLVAVLIFCVAFGASLSAANDLVVFRRLRHAPRIAPLIASLGLALIFQNLGIKINGSGPKKFHSIIPESPPYPSLAPSLEHAGYALIIAVPALFILMRLATRARHGLATAAVSFDKEVAQLMGINVNRTITRGFLIAGAAAAVAGVLYAQEFRSTDYSLGMRIGLLAYAAAIIGGVNRVSGTVFGGFLIGLIESLNIGLPSGLGYRWSETVIYSVFILMLVYRPQGIFGHSQENV